MLDVYRFSTGRYYVHLPTQSIYDKVMKFLEDEGFTTGFGDRPTKDNKWDIDGPDTYITNIFDKTIAYTTKEFSEAEGRKPLKVFESGEIDLFDLDKFEAGEGFVNISTEDISIETFNFLKHSGLEFDLEKASKELAESRSALGRKVSIIYSAEDKEIIFGSKALYSGLGLEELEYYNRKRYGVTFDLDKFRTGKFYVNIPSIEWETDIRQFLEDNGFEEVEGYPLTGRTSFSGSDSAVYCTGLDTVAFTSGVDWLEERGLRKLMFRSPFNEDNIKELEKMLLSNFIDLNGDLVLTGLDFSDFDGDIYLDKIKVKNDLIQSGNEVGGNVYQSGQKVGGSLYQSHNYVDEILIQSSNFKDGEEE